MPGRRRKRQADEEATKPASGEDSAKVSEAGEHGCHYNSGPAVKASRKAGRAPGAAADGRIAPEREEQSAPSVAGTGPKTKASAFAQTVRLQGRTDAKFDGGAFHTEDVHVEAGEGCEGCSGRQCIHVTGTLVATYSVATTVTLPSVSDFPDLTSCQRERVQAAITDVLAPHEQEHVDAFNTYNGTTRRQFDLTLCRNAFADRIREMHQEQATTREAAAQALSDALDPFHFDVDLDCEDDESQQSAQGLDSTATNTPDAEASHPGP